MDIYTTQRWTEYSGVVLIDNLGLSDKQLQELLTLNFTCQVVILSQERLMEDVLLQIHEHGVCPDPGLVLLPGRGALRAWDALRSAASELGLSLDWQTVSFEAHRVLRDREPRVELDCPEQRDAFDGQQWITILDDVVSSGTTVQAVRRHLQGSSTTSWRLLAPVVNLGRNEPTMVGFQEVYTGLAVSGCRGRNRVPIASLLGFVERDGWARRFAEKYLRRPDDFISFCRGIG